MPYIKMFHKCRPTSARLARTARWAPALPLLCALPACQSVPQNVQNGVTEYRMGQFRQAEEQFRPDVAKKDENFVLNNLRFGSAALAAGDVQSAETAFLSAYEVMNSVNTNDGGRTLGATLVFEGVKVWKGEPFERAMAHYYLGLVYLMKNDYENARAAFQNSLFKLREYAADSADKSAGTQKYKQFESTFALGYFGLGYCYQRLGRQDLSEVNYKQALEFDPSLQATITAAGDARTNTLLFIDFGHGPIRTPRGMYNEESVFYPAPLEAGPIPPVQVFIDNVSVTEDKAVYAPAVDTLAMAQEQRWQDIDTIRKAKAVIGTGLIAGGLGTSMYGSERRNGDVALIGAGIAGLGALMAATSQSDLRYWELLPRAVYVVPLSLTPGQHTAMAYVAGARTQINLNVRPSGDTVAYLRVPQ